MHLTTHGVKITYSHYERYTSPNCAILSQFEICLHGRKALRSIIGPSMEYPTVLYLHWWMKFCLELQVGSSLVLNVIHYVFVLVFRFLGQRWADWMTSGHTSRPTLLINEVTCPAYDTYIIHKMWLPTQKCVSIYLMWKLFACIYLTRDLVCVIVFVRQLTKSQDGCQQCPYWSLQHLFPHQKTSPKCHPGS